jgi:hypothetical protein
MHKSLPLWSEEPGKFIKDKTKKNEEDHNFTSLVAFIQHQAKHTKKQQKSLFIYCHYLEDQISNLEDPQKNPPPQNPILSKPKYMCPSN